MEDFNMDAPRTSEFANIRKNLKIDDKKTLFVMSEKNKNLYLSSRNLQNSKVITLSELNTYEIMNASALCFVESSLDVLQKNE